LARTGKEGVLAQVTLLVRLSRLTARINMQMNGFGADLPASLGFNG
jgi:hypothetical protein